jgi:hypothetical protein
MIRPPADGLRMTGSRCLLRKQEGGRGLFTLVEKPTPLSPCRGYLTPGTCHPAPTHTAGPSWDPPSPRGARERNTQTKLLRSGSMRRRRT